MFSLLWCSLAAIRLEFQGSVVVDCALRLLFSSSAVSIARTFPRPLQHSGIGEKIITKTFSRGDGLYMFRQRRWAERRSRHNTALGGFPNVTLHAGTGQRKFAFDTRVDRLMFHECSLFAAQSKTLTSHNRGSSKHLVTRSIAARLFVRQTLSQQNSEGKDTLTESQSSFWLKLKPRLHSKCRMDAPLQSSLDPMGKGDCRGWGEVSWQ